MAEDCLFCAIVAGDVQATILREDAATVTLADINPQSPTHVLVIPRAHYRDLAALSRDPDASAAVLHAVAASADDLGLTDYRTVFNTGAEAGQSVFHVHAHLLGGRPMRWPPG